MPKEKSSALRIPRELTVETKLKYLSTGYVVLDIHGINKLDSYVDDAVKAISLLSYGKINKEDIFNSRLSSSKGYIGVITRSATKIEGVDKFSLSMVKLKTPEDILLELDENIPSVVGMKITMEETYNVTRLSNQYEFIVKSIYLRMANGSYEVKRNIENLYNITKEQPEPLSSIQQFKGNQYFIAQEYMKEKEALAEISFKLPGAIDSKVIVSNWKTSYELKSLKPLDNKLIFGKVN